MSENWKVESVKEHFKVLKTPTRNLQQDLDTTNVRAVVEVVTNVLREHLIQDNVNVRELVRKLSVEIIRKHAGLVKFGFILIVTDKRVNGQFSKIPLFLIQYGNETVYIDVNCFSYMSWNAFMKQADKALPNCNFCVPIDGLYKDNRKLSVQFGTTISNPIWSFVKWGIAGALAAVTALYNTAPLLNLFKPLMKLAKKFLPKLDGQFMEDVYDLLHIISSFKEGSFLKCCPQLFTLLQRLHENHKEEINSMKDYISQTFGKIYKYVKEKVQMFFSSAPPLRLLSIIRSTNDEYLESNEYNGSEQSYSSQIFENCRNECAFQDNAKSKSDVLGQDIVPFTKSLIRMSEHCIANKSAYIDPEIGRQETSQHDLADIFLSVKELVHVKYEEMFGLYQQYLRAATVSAGHDIDIDRFNKSLGIQGKPTVHFMTRAMEAVEKSSLMEVVFKKCLELKEREPVLLVQIVKQPNNEKMGVYKCIGKGKDFVSAKTCARAVSNHLGVDVNSFVLKEENDENISKITLLCNDYVIFICQNKLSGNCGVEGMAVIHENPSA